MENDKAVKMIVGGKTWYYQAVVDEDATECEAIRLFGEDGEFLKEFSSVESMTEWMLDEVNRSQRKAKEKMQETIMRRLEKIKGDKSDSDFAVFLGMSGGTVYQYLVGRRFPSVAALAQIADKCGVTVDWLIGRDDES